jgi:hypothetical protein
MPLDKERQSIPSTFIPNSIHLNGCLCFVCQNHSGKKEKKKEKRKERKMSFFFSFNPSSSSSYIFFFFFIYLFHFWPHHFLQVDPTSSRKAPPSRCLLRRHNRYFSVCLSVLYCIPFSL